MRLIAPAVLAWAAIGLVQPSPTIEVFEGARVIVDARQAPVEDGVLVVRAGHIVASGSRRSVRIPTAAARVDLRGKTVMPAIVDGHVHLGYQVGGSFAADNYTRQTLIDQLQLYQRAGVAAVLTLGTDPPPIAEDITAAQRAGAVGGARLLFAGRGIAAPNAGPGTPELKASAYGVTTEDEARRAVRQEISRGVDVIKIWVDDRNHTVQKLSPTLYRAVIDEAHARRARVVAHIFSLEDAKDLARAGVDAFAHLVRDAPIDDELVTLMKQANVAQMPNIAISENAIHAQPPAWLDEPLLKELVSAEVIERMRGSYARRPADAVERAKTTYGYMQRSLAKLDAAGIPIVFGTDDGAVRDHVYAFTPHRELQLLAQAGLPPARVLDIATRATADFLHLSDLGTLAAGKRADFLVLDGDPLTNVANTTRIAAVYAKGKRLP